jgi:hypothetical protein
MRRALESHVPPSDYHWRPFDSGSVAPFLLFARHGIFELYVGSPLLLVQTSTYGVYPVARAALGLAIKNGSGHIADAQAWQLSLAGP